MSQLYQIRRVVLALAFALGAAIVFGDTPQIVNCDGYPILNFSLGANVSREGEAFRSLFFNRPQLGEGLDPLGGGQFHYEVDGFSRTASQCAKREVTRRWPFANIALEDADFADVSIQLRALVPNALDNVVVGTIPVALAEIRVTNRGPTERACKVRFDASKFFRSEAERIENEFVSGSRAGRNFVAWVLPTTVRVNGSSSTALFSVPAGEERLLRFMIGHWEDNWPSSSQLRDPEQVATHVARFWETLVTATERLSERIPRTGDTQLDDYLRWYTSAGVAMTRVLKDGTALTMGYHELNQRDSFWTSWVHLVFWPTLERRMIQESVWGQRPDGKVPTTILPLIERQDDVDINAYFILRGLRYVKFHQDDEFGRQILPALLNAADWLVSRDKDGDGLPEADSFWYDWKDVSGVEDRRYSPHASMLYVAAMRQLADYAEHLGDSENSARLRRSADRGNKLLQANIADGGLWGGTCYQEVWEDHAAASTKPRVLQDQVVGVLFGIVEDARSDQVLTSLRPNATQWGVRETFPYHDHQFGYEGGDYHNGGIWPWLNHVHAWALLQRGQVEEAIRLLKTVARADLEAEGDFIPHEYVHGETGKQAGVPMQGWNAAMFGTIYFGLPQDRQPDFPLRVIRNSEEGP